MSGRRDTLFGRDDELRALGVLLERGAQGSGGVVLITGEPGIGKTRLMEEIAAQAARCGFLVAWGRAWELGGSPSYWPWIEALRAVRSATATREPLLAQLARLLPGIDASAPRQTRSVDGFELVDTVAAYLRAAAAHTPILLLLDDLHAADPSSLELTEFVARRARDMRVCLIGSHRDVEARLAPGMDASLARISRAGEVLNLRRLLPTDVAALVQQQTGRSDGRTAALMHSASEGNPLFVHELLRLIAARGAMARAGHPSDIPAGVRAVIRERLALLSPATVALLQAAAVVGREFSLAVAAEVAGVTQVALDAAASEARAADLLADAGPGQLRFSHALVAETLALELPAGQRTRLHRVAAETLERLHGDNPSAPLGDIAHHWLQAGTDAAERAAIAAERAGEQAELRLAFADAAVLYEHAHAACTLAAPADAARHAQLLVLQIEALVRSGQRLRAESLCAAATQTAHQLGDGTLFARAALALGAEGTIGKADRVVIAALQEALSLLPAGDDPLRARVMAQLASARQPERDPSGPVALGREAIAMARRIDDPDVLLPVLHAAMGALMDYAPASERAPINQQVVQLASVVRDRPRALRASMRLAFDRIELGDLAGFEQAVEQYDAVARGAPQPRYQWGAPMLRSMRAYWEGRFEDAERLEHEARALWNSAGVEGVALAPMRDIARAMLRDNADLLEPALQAYMTLYPDAVEWRPLFAAYLAARRGQVQAASEHFGQIGSATLAFLLDDLHALEFLTEIACCLHDRDLAQRVYAHLLPYAGRPFMVTGIAFSVQDVIDRALLRLASVLGQFELADVHADAALALCTRLGAHPIAAMTQYDWAASLIDRAAAGRMNQARQLLTSAQQTAQRLGLLRSAELCQQLQARCEAGQPSPAAPAARLAAPPPVAARPPAIARTPDSSAAPISLLLEGEYWTLSGFGQLCRMRDGRGMRMLAQLIARPGDELHVLELSGVEGAVDGGDAGAVLDRTARGAYKTRLTELREELDEAKRWNDSARAERLQIEAETLLAQLAKATGLGGRDRRTGAAVERARVNVRRRLALVLRRIEQATPLLGKHLNATLHTGAYCSYDPER